MRKIFATQKGAAIVEFAIVLPLLLMLVFGIIEFGIMLYDKAEVTNASREGARTGIVYDYPNRVAVSKITTVVQNYLSGHMITFGTQPTISPIVKSGTTDASGNCTPSANGICVNAGDCLSVTVNYPYTFLALPNFVTSLVGQNPLTLSATTIMRCE